MKKQAVILLAVLLLVASVGTAEKVTPSVSICVYIENGIQFMREGYVQLAAQAVGALVDLFSTTLDVRIDVVSLPSGGNSFGCQTVMPDENGNGKLVYEYITGLTKADAKTHREKGFAFAAEHLGNMPGKYKLLLFFSDHQKWPQSYQKVLLQRGNFTLLPVFCRREATLPATYPEGTVACTAEGEDGEQENLQTFFKSIASWLQNTYLPSDEYLYVTEKEPGQAMVSPELFKHQKRRTLLVAPNEKAKNNLFEGDEICVYAGESENIVPDEAYALRLDRVGTYDISLVPLQNVQMGKGEKFALSCTIEPISSKWQLGKSPLNDPWEVSLYVGEEVYSASFNKEIGTYVAEITQMSSGTYDYYFKASGPYQGMLYESLHGKFTITNKAPEAVSERQDIFLYRDGERAQQKASIDVSTWFIDDDKQTLTYNLSPAVPGLTIEGSQLIFSQEAFEVNTFETMLKATDEEESASVVLGGSVYDMATFLALTPPILSFSPQELYKQDAVTGIATYTLTPEEQRYVAQLSSEQKEAFLARFSGCFVLEKQKIDERAMFVQENALCFEATFAPLKGAGEYELHFSLHKDGLPFGKNADALSLKIQNHPPAWNVEVIEQELVLPDIFSHFLENEEIKTESSILLSDYVKDEDPEETLTFTIQGEGMAFYKTEQENTYRLQDVGENSVEAIVWYTEEEVPTLLVSLGQSGTRVVQLHLSDSSGESPESGTINIRVVARCVHQRQINLAVFILVIILLLCTAFLIFWQKTKPSFAGCVLTLSAAGQETVTMEIGAWKKQPISLFEVLVYTGFSFEQAPSNTRLLVIKPKRRGSWGVSVPKKAGWTVSTTSPMVWGNSISLVFESVQINLSIVKYGE